MRDPQQVQDLSQHNASLKKTNLKWLFNSNALQLVATYDNWFSIYNMFISIMKQGIGDMSANSLDLIYSLFITNRLSVNYTHRAFNNLPQNENYQYLISAIYLLLTKPAVQSAVLNLSTILPESEFTELLLIFISNQLALYLAVHTQDGHQSIINKVDQCFQNFSNFIEEQSLKKHAIEGKLTAFDLGMALKKSKHYKSAADAFQQVPVPNIPKELQVFKISDPDSLRLNYSLIPENNKNELNNDVIQYIHSFSKKNEAIFLLAKQKIAEKEFDEAKKLLESLLATSFDTIGVEAKHYHNDACIELNLLKAQTKSITSAVNGLLTFLDQLNQYITSLLTRIKKSSNKNDALRYQNRINYHSNFLNNIVGNIIKFCEKLIQESDYKNAQESLNQLINASKNSIKVPEISINDEHTHKLANILNTHSPSIQPKGDLQQYYGQAIALRDAANRTNQTSAKKIETYFKSYICFHFTANLLQATENVSDNPCHPNNNEEKYYKSHYNCADILKRIINLTPKDKKVELENKLSPFLKENFEIVTQAGDIKTAAGNFLSVNASKEISKLVEAQATQENNAIEQVEIETTRSCLIL